ncbi:MAG: Re/Si-specific NAD(P)(+) transhydrogenase subunit alpha [Geminicoccaceae bacterium]
MKIGIPKERRDDERRAAASADTIKRYKGLGLEPVVEAGAGNGAAVSDQLFTDAGASVVDEAAAWDSEIVLKVQRPTDEEMARLKQGQVLIGMLDPYNSKEQVEAYAKAGVTAFAMELLPRTTRAQAMDVLSSQANLAGYKALVDAMAEYSRVLPMMMTAAGTVTPAKVFIVGAGVAGLQAIATARRMGAVVTATDVRPAAREETESLGAKFVGFIPSDAATKGGYARPLTPEEQAEQAKIVAEHLKGQDIVVTTAQIPGRKAPRIITAEMVKSMKAGAVVLDMAAESGGNVEGSKPGKTVTVGGVKLVGAKNLPARIAPATTVLYARNLLNFVTLLIDPESKQLKIDTGDDLIKGTMLTTGGAIVHDAFKPAA